MNHEKEFNHSFIDILVEAFPLMFMSLLSFIPIPVSLYFMKFQGNVESQARLTLMISFNNIIYEHMSIIYVCVILICTKYIHQKSYQ